MDVKISGSSTFTVDAKRAGGGGHSGGGGRTLLPPGEVTSTSALPQRAITQQVSMTTSSPATACVLDS